MAMTPLPTPPSSARPATFNADMDTFLAALPQFVTEANSLAATQWPKQFLYGLNTSNNVGTPNTKIDIAAGACRDDSNATNITAAGGTIDCTVVGANGIDAGALAASTWYYSFVIMKADGTVAYLLSLSLAGPTLPVGYIYKRALAPHKTDGSSHILKYRQYDDDFFWDAATIDASSVATSAATNILVAINVPPGLTVRPFISFRGSSSSGALLWQLADGGATAGAGGNGWFILTTSGADVYEPIDCLRTNTSRQITIASSTNFGIYTIWTLGWNWNRGKL